MNVPTITVNQTEEEKLKADIEILKEQLSEQLDTNKKLRAELENLSHLREEANAEARHRQDEIERAYMRGRIEGLEFSIRCNGVNGDVVK